MLIINELCLMITNFFIVVSLDFACKKASHTESVGLLEAQNRLVLSISIIFRNFAA